MQQAWQRGNWRLERRREKFASRRSKNSHSNRLANRQRQPQSKFAKPFTNKGLQNPNRSYIVRFWHARNSRKNSSFARPKIKFDSQTGNIFVTLKMLACEPFDDVSNRDSLPFFCHPPVDKAGVPLLESRRLSMNPVGVMDVELAFPAN